MSKVSRTQEPMTFVQVGRAYGHDKAVVLKGSELRQRFMRMALAAAEGIKVARSYCETVEGTALDKA